jgi:hypothetical protein
MKKFSIEDKLAALFILIGTAMRFYNYSNWSLSNDELSAMARLQFPSFSEMIVKGVKLDDMHPMGVQSFLWLWTNLTGLSDAMFRLPFVIMGSLSLVFFYLIASKWFNKSSALFSLAVFSALQFPILFSQLARPYSPGLLFSLMFVYAWTNIVFTDEKPAKKFNKWNVLLVLSGVAAMYTHYFSFMFVGIVGLAGLLFLKKELYWSFLLSGALMFLLYLPNLDVFLYQFGVGGLGGPEGWLGPPQKDAIFKYVLYGFNGDYILLGILLAAFVASYVFYKNQNEKRFKWLAFIFAMLPAVIAYFYSVFKNPVFQYSILIFGFPFLVMWIFSNLPSVKWNKIESAFLAFAFMLTFVSTVFAQRFYSTEHFAVFKDLAVRISDLADKYGKENIDYTVNVIKPYYFDHYANAQKNKVSFLQYRCNQSSDYRQLDSLLSISNKPFFLHAWSNNYHAPELELRIKKYFPFVAERDTHFNAGLVLYTKKDLKNNVYNPEVVYNKTNDFEKEMWGIDRKMMKESTTAYSGKTISFVDSTLEYSATFQAKVDNIGLTKDRTLMVSVQAKMNEQPLFDKLMLVVSLEDKEGKSKVWRSEQFAPYKFIPNQWTTIYYGYKYIDDINPDDIIKVYVYNPGKYAVDIDDFSVIVTK